nr:MAG TPA: LysM domain [Caudoviricetes sp.]
MKKIKEQGHMYGVLCIKEQSAWSTVNIADTDTHQGAVHTAHIKKEAIHMKTNNFKPRWGRIIGAIIIVLALIMGAVQVFSADTEEVTTKKTITVMYQVEEGDTLWSIVKDLMGESVNAQQVIYQIKKENKIQDTLNAGQVIKIRMPKQ